MQSRPRATADARADAPPAAGQGQAARRGQAGALVESTAAAALRRAPAYRADDMLADLLAFGASRLAPGGRLVFLWALPQTLSKKQGQHAATDGAALARRPPRDPRPPQTLGPCSGSRPVALP